MMTDFFSDLGPDYGGSAAPEAVSEVPQYLDALPDTGREVLVVGDVQAYKELNHTQGDNPYGFESTCGLVSCQDVLGQFGVNVSESDVVQYAVTDGLCQVTDSPESSGCTTLESQAKILTDAGVSAEPMTGASLNDLAGWVEQGRGVIVEVNAGELWDSPDNYGNGD